MAVEPEEDELLLDQRVEDQPNPEEHEEDQSREQPEGEDEELEVTFGDGAAPAPGESDTRLVKHLREQLRDRDRRLAEVERSRPSQKIEVGDKPTLAGCEYDEDAYEAQLDGWKARKAQAEAAESEADKANQEAREQWQRELQGHEAKRAALKFADAAEVEEIAVSALNEVQQAVIVKVAENSAQLLYALGKHPGKLAELSKITDPLKMAAAVARLEGGLKVMPKRRSPDPEEIARGTGSISHGADKELERLEKEADRSGDRSKLIAYRKRQKQAA